MNRAGKRGVIIACITLLSLWNALPAHALRVTVTRVVFAEGKRAESLVLVNNSDEEIAYRLGWRRMRMTTDGDLVAVADDGDAKDASRDISWAGDMVRFAPRRIVLPPGGAQHVRLMLRVPPDMPAGEYRAHFMIDPEPESAAAPTASIRMLTGVSLPVIVRIGKGQATADLTATHAVRKGDSAKISLTLTRAGDHSLYGDFYFSCDDRALYHVRGISVYTEITRRDLHFTVPAIPPSCRNLQVEYRAANDDAPATVRADGKIIASTIIPLP